MGGCMVTWLSSLLEGMNALSCGTMHGTVVVMTFRGHECIVGVALGFTKLQFPCAHLNPLPQSAVHMVSLIVASTGNIPSSQLVRSPNRGIPCRVGQW